MIEVVITKKDEKNEYIDPLESIKPYGDEIIINNGSYNYKYKLSDIICVSFREI